MWSDMILHPILQVRSNPEYKLYFKLLVGLHYVFNNANKMAWLSVGVFLLVEHSKRSSCDTKITCNGDTDKKL